MRVGKANGGEWLRLAEAAAALGVSHNTLRHWSDEGRVRSYRSPGGHRRYRRGDIEALFPGAIADAGAAARLDRSGPEEAWRDSALDALVAVAAHGSGTTSCIVAVQDGDDALRIAAVYGDGEAPAVGALLPLASLPAEAEVVRSHRRLHIPDVARTRLLARATADEFCRKGLLALLALPLDLDDGRVGVLRLGDSRGPHSFDLDAMTFAEFMARHAAILLCGGPGQPPPALHGDGPAGMLDLGRPRSPSPEVPPPSPAAGLAYAARAAVDTLGGRVEPRHCAVYLVKEGRAQALASSPDASAGDWDLKDLAPAAATVAGRDVVLLRRDDERLDDEARARFFDTRDSTALVLAPIERDGETIGLLEAGGVDLAGLWGAVPAIRAAASLVAAAVLAEEERFRLQGRERSLGLLREVWQQDTSQLSAEQVLRDLVERLALATRAPIVEVYAVEGDTARALVSYDGGRWDSAWEDVVLRLARYPTSLRAVETGEAVLVSALEDESLDRDDRLSLERWGYQSHLSVPLLHGGRTLGLLELYDYVPRDFAPDLELARGVGRVAALTLENERLEEQVRRRGRLVSELEAVAELCAAATDTSALLATVAERIQEVLDAASCQMFRLTPRGVLCIASHDRSGRDDAAVGLLTDLGDYPTVVNAMNARDALVITSLEDERLTDRERAAYRASGWASELCVPLLLQDGLYGFIDVLDSRSRGFAEHAGFLRSVADMLAVALEAARLQDEVTRRSGDLESLAALGRLQVREGLGGDVLERLAAEIRRRVGATDCDVFSLDEAGLRCLVSVDEHGRDDSVSKRPLDIDDYPATAQAVRSAQMVVLPDVDDPRRSEGERADMDRWGFRSEVCLPLVWGGRVGGLIDIFDSRQRDYAEHRDYLLAAGRVAAAILAAVLATDGYEG